MRSKYFASACVLTTIMVSGCINNNVLLYHTFYFVSFHGSTSVPGLTIPFWPVWNAEVPLIFMTQYLVWNYQQQKRGNKTAVDNVTSASQLRNPPLMSPAIEVINLRAEKVCYLLLFISTENTCRVCSLLSMVEFIPWVRWFICLL